MHVYQNQVEIQIYKNSTKQKRIVLLNKSDLAEDKETKNGLSITK